LVTAVHLGSAERVNEKSVWSLEVGVSFSTASSTATSTRVEELATCVKLCHVSVCNCVKLEKILQPASSSAT